MSGKMFNCPHCSITYKQERFLVKHISTKHNLEPNQTTNTNLEPNQNQNNPYFDSINDEVMMINRYNKKTEEIIKDFISKYVKDSDIKTRNINMKDIENMSCILSKNAEQIIFLKKILVVYVDMNNLLE
jgi:hypothetical protein